MKKFVFGSVLVILAALLMARALEHRRVRAAERARVHRAVEQLEQMGAFCALVKLPDGSSAIAERDASSDLVVLATCDEHLNESGRRLKVDTLVKEARKIYLVNHQNCPWVFVVACRHTTGRRQIDIDPPHKPSRQRCRS